MHRAHPNGAILTPYARKLIGFRAGQFSRSPRFTPAEREDLQQDLWLALAEQASRFDPARAALDTFIHHVVTTAAHMLLRRRHWPKRFGAGRMKPLDHAPRLNGHKATLLARIVSADENATTHTECGPLLLGCLCAGAGEHRPNGNQRRAGPC